MNAYNELLSKYKEYYLLDSAAGAIGWDFETYMPPNGVGLRSEQLALLGKIQHELVISSEFGKILREAEKLSESLDKVGKRNLFLARKEYDLRVKVPADLVAEIAKQQAIAVDIWKKAKAAKNWKMFEPDLQKIIDLSRKRAEIRMGVLGSKTLYDAMLDEFERNMTAAQISKVFGQLRDGLVPLVGKCVEASKDIDSAFLTKEVPIDIQRKIATDIGNLIEYDTTSEKAGGRIDETEHPFTGGYFSDVRVTVNYQEDNVSSMIFAMLHEGGHALYEQNLNQNWMYQPIGIAASYGIHESMSRFIENVYGRTSEFWEHYLPRFNDFTGGTFSDINALDFTRAVNLVQPSKIRIEADEVSYSLHVIIRFEIERDLFADKITVSELPQVWNEKYDEYLGMEIKDDAEGVLQDTHWASGYFGYFPSYALGNVYDGQWIQKLSKDLPDWTEMTRNGSFGPIKKWLVENIMSKASLYDPTDLVRHVTGSDLNAKPFLDFVEHRYSHMYGF